MIHGSSKRASPYYNWALTCQAVGSGNIRLYGFLYQCWLTTSMPFICISVPKHLPIQILWYKVGGSKKRLSRAVVQGMDFSPSCKVRTLPLSLSLSFFLLCLGAISLQGSFKVKYICVHFHSTLVIFL